MSAPRPGTSRRKDTELHQMTLQIPETQYRDLMRLAEKRGTTPTGLVKSLVLLELHKEQWKE